MNDQTLDISEDNELFIKFLQQKANQEELDFLRTWIAQSIENKLRFENYRDLWYIANRKSTVDDFNANSAWTSFASKIKQTDQKSEPIKQDFKFNSSTKKNRFSDIKWKSLLQIAAVAILAFGLGMLLVQSIDMNSKDELLVFSEHIVPLGAKSQLILPDGSIVWLNAGSRFKYAQNFNVKKREVFLEGEAYFDIKPNEDKIFWVHTYAGKIKVVGTAFNVKAYREENTLETTVERGEVRFFGNDTLEIQEDEIKLQVKQQIKLPTYKLNPQSNTKALNKRPNEIKYTIRDNVATELYTSWKDKNWVIEGEKLGSLAIKIERRYDVKIHFNSEDLKLEVFSGRIQNETLDQLLQAMCLSTPISYKYDKKDVYLKRANY